MDILNSIIFIFVLSLFSILGNFLIICKGDIIGFDCNSNNTIIKKFSLLNVKHCEGHKINKSQEMEKEIQLIQLRKFREVNIISCLISETLLVFRCGKSWQQFQQSGILSNTIRLDYNDCQTTVSTQIFNYRNKVSINNLKLDSINKWRGTIFGTVDNDGNCESGGVFSIDGQNYNRAVVTSELKILISTDKVSVNIEEGLITLKSGIRCKYTDFECFDITNGWTYWTSEKILDSCGGSIQYDVLYQGKSKKLISLNKEGNNNKITYFVSTNDLAFALAIDKQILVCNQHAFQTEHPKLMIIEKNEFEFILKKSDLMVKNIDLFTYVNSKFIHITKDIKVQVEDMYSKIMLQKCESDRISLKNLLNIAILDPELFAYSIMEQPGFTAIIRGEVIYIVKCNPKLVNLRKSTTCYNDLPISFNNKSLFLRPRSRLIIDQGKEIDCSNILHSSFYLNDLWFSNGLVTIETNPPLELTPNEHLSWEFNVESRILNNGIYRLDELDSFSQLIMDPISKKTINENFIRAIDGKGTIESNISILRALNQKDLEILHESYWKNIFKTFFYRISSMGSVFSFLIGIFVVIKMIKSIIEIIISGKFLYNLYGISWKIFGCFSESLVVLYKMSKQKKTSNEYTKANDKELGDLNKKQKDQDLETGLKNLKENKNKTEELFFQL